MCCQPEGREPCMPREGRGVWQEIRVSADIRRRGVGGTGALKDMYPYSASTYPVPRVHSGTGRDRRVHPIQVALFRRPRQLLFVLGLRHLALVERASPVGGGLVSVPARAPPATAAAARGATRIRCALRPCPPKSSGGTGTPRYPSVSGGDPRHHGGVAAKILQTRARDEGENRSELDPAIRV